MSKIIHKLKRRILRYKVSRYLKKDYNKLESYGSSYGSWTVPTDLFDNESIFLLAGAGEDVTFDLAITDKYKCRTVIIDPTPRAKKHYELIGDQIADGMLSFEIGSTSYKIQSKENISSLQYASFGIWSKNEKVKFYEPSDASHVSHSIINLQKTNKYFEAEVLTIASICERYGFDRVDLLKLDIEGAEYEVIENVLKGKILPKVICVEFDEYQTPKDNNASHRIMSTVRMIIEKGYMLKYLDEHCNCTFQDNSK